jgi:3-oxoacyl-[acyl-carrier protein] reductase
VRIIITGASGGLGIALVKRIMAMNHDVLAMVRDKQKSSKVLDAIGSNTNGNLEFLYADLSVEKEISSITAQLKELEIDTVDGIIHNAGILYKENFPELSDEEMHKMFQVNLFAPIKLTQKLLPLILRSGTPMMVFISSMAGIQGADKFGGLSIYGTTKAGLIGFAEQLSAELIPLGVRVLNIAPGAIKTSMLVKAFPGYSGGLNSEQVAARIVEIMFNESIKSASPIIVRAGSSEL